MNETQPWHRWFEAARSPAVDRAIRELYDRVDSDIASRNPTCWLSGKCCKFESYGHRLYVTGLEIAWVVAKLDTTARDRLTEAKLPGGDGCPFQINKMCSVHGIRPLGCRVFFCDPTAQDWQHELYERFLTDLKRMHEQYDVPYRYMEWRVGLSEMLVETK